jgi:hypothetical protein
MKEMKRTEYFLGESNSASTALQQASQLRDTFLRSNLEKIGDLDEEIHVSTCGTHNNIFAVIVIQLTYYLKKEE